MYPTFSRRITSPPARLEVPQENATQPLDEIAHQTTERNQETER